MWCYLLPHYENLQLSIFTHLAGLLADQFNTLHAAACLDKKHRILRSPWMHGCTTTRNGSPVSEQYDPVRVCKWAYICHMRGVAEEKGVLKRRTLQLLFVPYKDQYKGSCRSRGLLQQLLCSALHPACSDTITQSLVIFQTWRPVLASPGSQTLSLSGQQQPETWFCSACQKFHQTWNNESILRA